MSLTPSNDYMGNQDPLKNQEIPQGKLAQQGMQPSFATELSLDTIEHVSPTNSLVLNVSRKLISLFSLGLLWVSIAETISRT
jgi:hypothetical protein